MKCSICQKPIETRNGWDQGHNANPVNNGRCCDHCDKTVVIPSRLQRLWDLDRSAEQKHR
jgi:hypothetical protein